MRDAQMRESASNDDADYDYSISYSEKEMTAMKREAVRAFGLVFDVENLPSLNS